MSFYSNAQKIVGAADRDYVDYALSTFGKAIPWSAADAFTLYFLTDVAGLPVVESGLIVFLFFAWNALCDPLVGWALDRFWSHRAPPTAFFIVTAVAAAVFFVLSFTLSVSGVLRAPLLVGAGLAFRSFYSAMDVPHNAILARLAERGRAVGLGAMRLLASIGATLAISFAAKGAVGAGGGGAPMAFTIYAFVLTVVSTIMFLVFLPKARARCVEPPHESATDATIEAPPQIGGLALLFLSAMAATLVSSVFSKDLIYIAKYVFSDASRVVRFLSAMTIGKLLAIPLWWWAPRRFGVVGSMAAAYGLTAAAGALLAWLGPQPQLFESTLVVLGMGIGGANMLTWAMLPALARLGEGPGARSMATRVFGAYTAMTKLSAGASGALLGMFLALAGIERAAPQSAASNRLYLMACLVPVIGSGVCVLCLGGYQVLRHRAVLRLRQACAARAGSETLG